MRVRACVHVCSRVCARVCMLFLCLYCVYSDVVLVNRGWYPRSILEKTGLARGSLRAEDSGPVTVSAVLRPCEEVSNGNP
jgi:cytochrome oxidase assembly protein ShyY1